MKTWISRIDKSKDRKYEVARLYNEFLVKIKLDEYKYKHKQKFTFSQFFHFYNFLIEENNEILIHWFWTLEREPLVIFLNNLFDLEKEIKNFLFSYFYRVEANINKNFELLIFRYFFENEALENKIEDKHKNQILNLIEGKFFEQKEKQKLFKELNKIFYLYRFDGTKELNKYIKEWKNIIFLRNQIMHPNSIEEFLKLKKSINFIEKETKDEWISEILKIFIKHKSLINQFFHIYINDLEEKFSNFLED